MFGNKPAFEVSEGKKIKNKKIKIRLQRKEVMIVRIF